MFASFHYCNKYGKFPIEISKFPTAQTRFAYVVVYVLNTLSNTSSDRHTKTIDFLISRPNQLTEKVIRSEKLDLFGCYEIVPRDVYYLLQSYYWIAV